MITALAVAAAVWTLGSLATALWLSAVMHEADTPLGYDVPDTVPAEWVTA